MNTENNKSQEEELKYFDEIISLLDIPLETIGMDLDNFITDNDYDSPTSSSISSVPSAFSTDSTDAFDRVLTASYGSSSFDHAYTSNDDDYEDIHASQILKKCSFTHQLISLSCDTSDSTDTFDRVLDIDYPEEVAQYEALATFEPEPVFVAVPVVDSKAKISKKGLKRKASVALIPEEDVSSISSSSFSATSSSSSKKQCQYEDFFRPLGDSEEGEDSVVLSEEDEVISQEESYQTANAFVAAVNSYDNKALRTFFRKKCSSNLKINHQIYSMKNFIENSNDSQHPVNYFGDFTEATMTPEVYIEYLENYRNVVPDGVMEITTKNHRICNEKADSNNSVTISMIRMTGTCLAEDARIAFSQGNNGEMGQFNSKVLNNLMSSSKQNYMKNFMALGSLVLYRNRSGRISKIDMFYEYMDNNNSQL